LCLLSIFKRSFNRILHTCARQLPGCTTVRPFIHKLRGVSIGSDVFIGDEVYIENDFPELISLGDHVQIALRSVLIAHTLGKGRIIIEDNAYIGASCVIACSAGKVLTIGSGAVVGAGSIITSSVSPNCFVRNRKPHVVAKVGKPLPLCSSFNEFLSGLTIHK